MKGYLCGAVLCCTVLAAGAAAPAERATVNEESASVYSQQRRSPDEIVKSLKRGDAVAIRFSIASGDGEWCAVSEPDGSTPLGYMLCRHLRREPARAETFVSIPPSAAPPNAPNAPAVSGRAAPVQRDPAAAAGEDYARPIRYWATLFHFTAEQQATVDGLADSTGVTDCRRQYEAHYRTYAPELALAETNLVPRQPSPAYQQRIQNMVRDLNRFLYPCELKMLGLLERYPGLMTPEQQSNAPLLAAFKKQLADQRRVLTSPDMYPGIR
jgi:hypothetical protein